MKVKDLMVENVVTIGAKVHVRAAAKLMNHHEIGCLVVVEDRKPIGIVTERDMLKRVLSTTRDPRALKVGDIMSKPVIVMEHEMNIGDAVKLMFDHGIKKLPVVKRGHLVGIVSLTDVISSPEMTKWLEKLSLEDTPGRIRKIITAHFGIKIDRRKRCQLPTEYARISISCQERDCPWWLEDECAIVELIRKISNFAQYTSDLTIVGSHFGETV
jgi:CBS domain-containing protein